MTREKPAIAGGTPVFETPLAFNQPTLPAFSEFSGALEEIFSSGQLTNGLNVKRLEAKAEALFGRPAVALANCTSGLILTLKLLGLSGKVIVPSFTFFATSHALIWNGLEPLFVDITPDTWTIDPKAVEAAITPEVSAILSVDVFGNPCDKTTLGDIAEKHGLALITDAAHSLGGYYKGRPVGGFGDAEVFSLSPTKLVAAGEGGLVGVASEDLADRLKIARDYGNPGDYNCGFVGLNARLPEINAVAAGAGMEILANNVTRRNRLAQLYKEGLAEVPGISWQRVAAENVCTYKDISLLIDSEEFGLKRDALVSALAAEGIPTRTYYDPPAHKQSAYEGLFAATAELGVTTKLCAGILSLPVYSHMTEADVSKVCLAIKRTQAYEALS